VNKTKHKPPTPASERTVSLAREAFLLQEPKDATACAAFLDKVGMRNLHDPASVVAMSDSACRAIKEMIEQFPELATAALQRMTDCILPSPIPMPHKSAYLWLAQCAGHAIPNISGDSNAKEEILRRVAFMPLNSEPYESWGQWMRAQIARHPDCPADVLYFAAANWPLHDVRFINSHPSATDEARVILALRS